MSARCPAAEGLLGRGGDGRGARAGERVSLARGGGLSGLSPGGTHGRDVGTQRGGSPGRGRGEDPVGLGGRGLCEGRSHQPVAPRPPDGKRAAGGRSRRVGQPCWLMGKRLLPW